MSSSSINPTQFQLTPPRRIPPYRESVHISASICIFYLDFHTNGTETRTSELHIVITQFKQDLSEHGLSAGGNKEEKATKILSR